MWIGACTSAIGTWMQMLAQGWLIWKMSHCPFLLSLDPILQATPIFLFSLVGGVFADRIERRHLLMFSQFLQMSCALVLTFLVGFHVVKVWHFLTCSFVVGFAQAFGGPAYTALIPTLVSKEDMPNAIALNSIQFNAAVMIGPALGGVALAKLGATWCFALNTLSFLAPVVSLMMLTVRFLPEKTTESILGSMKEGIRFVRKQGAMEGLIVLAFCMTALILADEDPPSGVRHGHPSQRFRHVRAVPVHIGHGLGGGRAGRSRIGKRPQQRPHCSRHDDLPGGRHFGLWPFPLRRVELRRCCSSPALR